MPTTVAVTSEADEVVETSLNTDAVVEADDVRVPGIMYGGIGVEGSCGGSRLLAERFGNGAARCSGGLTGGVSFFDSARTCECSTQELPSESVRNRFAIPFACEKTPSSSRNIWRTFLALSKPLSLSCSPPIAGRTGPKDGSSRGSASGSWCRSG